MAKVMGGEGAEQLPVPGPLLAPHLLPLPWAASCPSSWETMVGSGVTPPAVTVTRL